MSGSATRYDDSRALFSPKARETSVPANKFQSYLSNASAIRGKGNDITDFNNSTSPGSGIYARYLSSISK